MPECLRETTDPELLADMKANPHRYFSVENRPHQRAFFYDPHVAVLVKGPNQVGKSLIARVYAACAMMGEEPFELQGMLDVRSLHKDQWGRYPRMIAEPPIRVRDFCVDLERTAKKVMLPHYLEWIPGRHLDTSKGENGFNTKENTLYLRNGSFVQFMSYDMQALKSQSAQAHIVILDEAPRQSTFEDQFPRIIALGGRIFIVCTITDSAPWPTDWIDKLFERGGPQVQKYASVHYLDAMENFNALANADPVSGGRILENKDAMLALVREQRLRTIFHGESARRGHVVYPEFDEKVHGYGVAGMTPDLFAQLAQGGWGEVWCGFDYGERQPTAVPYIYVARRDIPELKLYPGDCVQFAEFYRGNSNIVANLPALQANHRRFCVRGYVADPALWKQKLLGSDIPLAMLYADVKLLKRFISGTELDATIDTSVDIGPMFQANNSVEARIEVVHALLAPRAEPAPWSRYRVLVEHCPATCEDMASWATKSDPDMKMAKDRYTEHNKHMADAIGYFAMSPALESWRLALKTADERAWSPRLDPVFGVPAGLAFSFAAPGARA